MNIPPIERKIRGRLPFIRFFQTSIPLPVARWLIKQGMKGTQLRAGIIRQGVIADGVPCEWIIPQNSSEDKVLLYLHGGGFVFGLTYLHLQMVAYLANNLGIQILMVDYRLGPEYPFPAALEDCVTAYYWLLKQDILPKNVGVAGDSAGGNLTLTMLMKLRDSGDSLPAAAACLSPVTDLATKNKQRQGFKDPLLSPKAVKFFHQSYLGNHDPNDPLVSPVFGNLRGLPPLLVHAGEEERLCDDAIRITKLAKSVGVDVRLEIYPRMWHVWQLFLAMPQAIQSLDDITLFFNSHLKPSN